MSGTTRGRRWTSASPGRRPDDRLLEEARELALRIAERPADAVANAKSAINAGLHSTLQDAMARETEPRFVVSCLRRRRQEQKSFDRVETTVTVSRSPVPGMHDDEIEDRVLPKILLRQAERLGSAPFLDICGRRANFEEMFDVSWRLAERLRMLGIGRSDRVACCFPIASNLWRLGLRFRTSEPSKCRTTPV